ncbi:E3 ubiquitin-protein ligase RNF14-like [Sphaeramia orbicularis]|uniref:E3 ubiquitin-protein ligase RNF14-like n=1 Tax=Sphaeramia orbicularis TaxID=375764 RepID=UPI00118150AA|nr:E3 ubiquitin-protein ligase RNF14-like [Sphaeramia orbicularis]
MNALWDDYSSGSKDRRRLLESRYGRCNLVVTMESRLSQEWIAVTCKNCPYCFSRIEKNGGCNRMTCSRCSRQFCWACLTKLTYENNHQHFSHDSPCTIWFCQDSHLRFQGNSVQSFIPVQRGFTDP